MRTPPNLAMFFCRHLVAVVVTVKDLAGATQSDASTFFVLEVRGHWFLVTAGHVLRKLQNIATSARFTSVDFRLFDSWRGELGAEPVAQSQPFNFHDAQPVWVDDDQDGIDMGFMMVPEFLRRSLESRGIVGLSEPTWDFVSDAPFDGHALLGLPTQLIQLRGDRLGFQPVLFAVKECSPPDSMKKPTARFHGQINLNGSIVSDIDGLSGGPIFGIRKVGDQTRYYLVAIQSAWRRELNVVNGNFAFELADTIAEAFGVVRAEEVVSQQR